MKNKFLKLAVAATLSLVALSANADLIQLDFKVDITSKTYGTNNSTSYNPPISFDYVVSIDDTSINNYTSSSGVKFSNLGFSSSTIPETQFTAEVLANNTIPLNPFWKSTSLYREYNPNMYGAGQGGTFQAIFLTTDASSTISPITNQWNNYQRGIQLQAIIQSGDTTTTFTSTSFQAYMNTLVGNSSFAFNDTYLISQYYPVTNSSNSISTFGYWGKATLLSVVAVPEADTSAMLLMGIGFIGFMARRRKNQQP